YTSFRFSGLTVQPSGGGFNVSFAVRNVGNLAGGEIAQVYLAPAPSVPIGVQQAIRSLAGFDRVVLGPHQTKLVTIHIGPGTQADGHGDPRAFQYWSTLRQQWLTSPGRRRVWVGSADSPPALKLSAIV
ncbi:MAG TPA: fibronectin type III-like domain-contianing protein, partial [Solirubrobacteraceae bacterium]|nr:fibronectin type III-like domain-contianing protein [Solirubrobacteraceae bacterium]